MRRIETSGGKDFASLRGFNCGGFVQRATNCMSVGVVDAVKFLQRECSSVPGVRVLERGSERMITNLPIACEFPELFPDDIIDLPSQDEIEFVIGLVHGTSIMSMAPYKMSSLEMSEMKKQLEDLLEKKFVRPSVSTWGVLVLLVKKKYGSIRLCVDYQKLDILDS